MKLISFGFFHGALGGVKTAKTSYMWFYRHKGESILSRQQTKDPAVCQSITLHICWYRPHAPT